MIQILRMGTDCIITVTYKSRGETWVFAFRPDNSLRPKQQMAVFAQSKELNFTWHDAAACKQLIDAAVDMVTHRRKAA